MWSSRAMRIWPNRRLRRAESSQWWEVRPEVALDLDEGLVRHDWFVEPEIEGGQEEVAGEDRYEEVGIEGRNEHLRSQVSAPRVGTAAALIEVFGRLPTLSPCGSPADLLAG